MTYGWDRCSGSSSLRFEIWREGSSVFRSTTHFSLTNFYVSCVSCVSCAYELYVKYFVGLIVSAVDRFIAIYYFVKTKSYIFYIGILIILLRITINYQYVLMKIITLLYLLKSKHILYSIAIYNTFIYHDFQAQSF